MVVHTTPGKGPLLSRDRFELTDGLFISGYGDDSGVIIIVRDTTFHASSVLSKLDAIRQDIRAKYFLPQVDVYPGYALYFVYIQGTCPPMIYRILSGRGWLA